MNTAPEYYSKSISQWKISKAVQKLINNHAFIFQNRQLTPTLALKGSTGWVWMSLAPSNFSFLRRD